MNCSIHKEMQLITDHGGNEEVSDLKYRLSAGCYKPNRRVGINRIHVIEQLRFLYSLRQKSFFVIELGYFNVSILMCYSLKKFKRVTVTVCLQARSL